METKICKAVKSTKVNIDFYCNLSKENDTTLLQTGETN